MRMILPVANHGYRQQVIYDEGDSNNGLLIVNDEGTIRAQVIVNGTHTEVNSTALLQSTNESLSFLSLLCKKRNGT